MGIFSLFGKKEESRKAEPADKDTSRTKRQSPPVRSDSSKPGSRKTAVPTVKRDEQTARATALKIDAIESEMSSEFVHVTTTQQLNTSTHPKPVKPALEPQPEPRVAPRADARTDSRTAPRAEPKKQPELQAATLQPLMPGMGTTTEFLLGGETAVCDVAAPTSEAAAVIEETAIMYANNQTDLVEQMLRGAIAEDMLGDVTRNAWWMLFDLYQITGKQQEFETLSMEYASKFETSPPAWTGNCSHEEPAGVATKNATPTVPFAGKLDENTAKLVERVRKLAETYRTLRLEFARVTQVTPGACSLLLDLLNRLQKSGHDLILVGAPELTEYIRAIIEVGRRDDTENSWLLLLELLRLLNREQEFEEVSIDYCVTFEVSPPAFAAPKNKVITAAAESHTVQPIAEGFMMPALIEGRIDSLIVAIAAYSDENNPAIIDCSQLVRIDFNAAGRLLTGLAPFCGAGKTLEFHHVNHLVTELFNVIGLKDIVRIFSRKN